MFMCTGSNSPADWQEVNASQPVPFWESLYADMIAHIPLEERAMPTARWIWTMTIIALRSVGFHAMLLYRLSHTARWHLGIVGKMFAGAAFWLGRHWHGCTLAPKARLYGGLILPHPQGIVIGPQVVVGPRAWILQNVTLGGVPEKDGMPRIGADSRIYAGAVVVGPITLGDNVMIGANAVVTENINSRTLVRQSPVVSSSLPERFLANPE